MKIFSALLIAMNISAFSIVAQENTTEPVQSIENSIVFDFYEYDYGTIEYNGDGKCTFKFTNTGDTPIMLTNVRASCGCTVPNWSRNPIKPGEQGEIIVNYKTKIAGTFNKSITVYTNTKPSSIVLRIRGSVTANHEEIK